jgi:nucleotide-binding universal stress UspA family protein
MKTILVTTDFSHHSNHTIDYVLEFLRDTQIPCKLLLLNTYMVQATNPAEVISMNDELRKRSHTGLESAMLEARSKITNPNITVEVASHMGTLNNVILNLLSKKKIDMVAMGKNGGWHVEMVASLLKQQKCPLLITYAS